MDPLTTSLQPLAIDRRGVRNFSVPIRGRARLKSGWDALLAYNNRFEKINHENENILSCLDEDRFWDIDTISRLGMMMVPMLVRTQPYHPTLDTYSPSCSLNIPRARAGGENGLIVADTLLEKAMQFANAICSFGRDLQTELKAGSKFINDGFLHKIVDQTYSSKMFPSYYAYTQPLLLVTSANKPQRRLNPNGV